MRQTTTERGERERDITETGRKIIESKVDGVVERMKEFLGRMRHD